MAVTNTNTLNENSPVFVDNSLDLIDTARLMADNNSHEIGKLMAEGKFGLVTEQQARQFLAHNQEM